MMTLEEVKQAIEDGKTVCWASRMYEVRKTMIVTPDCQCSLGRGSSYKHCDCNDSSCTLHHDSPMDIKRRQEQTERGWRLAKLDTPRPVYDIVCIHNQMSWGLTALSFKKEKEEAFFINDGELFGSNWERKRAGVRLDPDGGDPDVHPLEQVLAKIKGE